MEVHLMNQEGVVGKLRLKDGKVQADAGAKALLKDMYIHHPVTGEQATPGDGKFYLFGVVLGLQGTYLWAELVGDLDAPEE